jgi:hypothetical protein
MAPAFLISALDIGKWSGSCPVRFYDLNGYCTTRLHGDSATFHIGRIDVHEANRSLRSELNSVASVRERTIRTERPLLVGELVANFAARRCHVVSMTHPYGRILGFIDRSRYLEEK